MTNDEINDWIVKNTTDIEYYNFDVDVTSDDAISELKISQGNIDYFNINPDHLDISGEDDDVIISRSKLDDALQHSVDYNLIKRGTLRVVLQAYFKDLLMVDLDSDPSSVISTHIAVKEILDKCEEE